ncbi:hypothetical protein L7F22_001652 [Adiantum nelumboides]|nr:hypothetical protein [Adiantum nelumboides]
MADSEEETMEDRGEEEAMLQPQPERDEKKLVVFCLSIYESLICNNLASPPGMAKKRALPCSLAMIRTGEGAFPLVSHCAGAADVLGAHGPIEAKVRGPVAVSGDGAGCPCQGIVAWTEDERAGLQPHDWSW